MSAGVKMFAMLTKFEGFTFNYILCAALMIKAWKLAAKYNCCFQLMHGTDSMRSMSWAVFDTLISSLSSGHYKDKLSVCICCMRAASSRQKWYFSINSVIKKYSKSEAKYVVLTTCLMSNRLSILKYPWAALWTATRLLNLGKVSGLQERPDEMLIVVNSIQTAVVLIPHAINQSPPSSTTTDQSRFIIDHVTPLISKTVDINTYKLRSVESGISSVCNHKTSRTVL